MPLFRPDVFQSTPPRGGRRNGEDRPIAELEFQSTPPRGGRPVLRFLLWPSPGFNPRPRVGGDRGQGTPIHARRWFQSTPPRGGRLTLGVQRRLHCLFQSTPPRGGRHRCIHRNGRIMAVSIHAPAWGATGVKMIHADLSKFQSTPPRGGRPQRQAWTRSSGTCFNPRPRVGGDGVIRDTVTGLSVFQSTPPRGGRPRAVITIKILKFQSTPPRGGRRRVA